MNALRRSWRNPLATAARVAVSLARERGTHPFVTVPFDRTGTLASADLRTPFGRWLYRYRLPYDDDDFQVLRDCLRPGAVFVDCGANVGHFTLTAAPLVGPTGRVIALEPSPSARANLERSIVVNAFSHVDILPFAVGAAPSASTFTLMGGGDGLSSFAPARPDEGRDITVRVERLDDCVPDELFNRVSLVKMDVEGAEHAALLGAKGLLESRVPFLVEIEDDHLRRQNSSATDVYSLFAEYGYAGVATPGPSPNVLFSTTP